MSSVVSVRLDEKDVERLDSLGDRRKVLTKAIRLLFAVKQMDVNEESDCLQGQHTLGGVIDE